jgi:hypothetical protein
MSVTAKSSAALPLAVGVLRFLIILNWLYAAVIVALLVVLQLDERWIISAFRLAPSPDTEMLLTGMRVIALLGLGSIPMNYVVLKRLLSIVETVRAGDPFVAANAGRLRTIGWALLGLNVLAIVIGFVADSVSTPKQPFEVDAGFSLSGWLAVLLTFVLARVFAEGALMREDLEGTV